MDAQLFPVHSYNYNVGPRINYVLIAGFTLLIYDWLLTLQHEVELIWSRLDRVASIVFIILRYTAIGMLAVATYDNVYPDRHSEEFCKTWILLEAYLTIMCFIAVHVVVAIRVNAFHNNNPRIRGLLILCGVAYALSTFTFFTVSYIKGIGNTKPTRAGGCLTTVPEYLWIGWTPTVFFESILFVLTSYHAMRSFPKSGSFQSYYKSLYRDGVIFYVVIALCSLCSLLIWALAPSGSPWLGIASPSATCILGVVGSRFIINLRIFAASSCSYHPEDEENKSSVIIVTSPSFHFIVHEEGGSAGRINSTTWHAQDERPS